jgi:hypothetical protein
MSKLAHASATKEHDNYDDFQGTFRRAAERRELRACSRTVGYFTPVHERGTKWENIEEHIPTILRQAPLIGFMNLAPLKAAYDCHCT